MKVEIFTNQVGGGWHPEDITNFLGGNEESVLLFSEALARQRKDTEIIIYTTLRIDGEIYKSKGVTWKHIKAFQIDDEHDVLITMKDRQLWFRGVEANLKIHWSNDVEPPWATGILNHIDHFICIGTYHRDRLPWLPEEKITYIPLGMDMRPFKNCKVERDNDLAIYISSPDRGLETLLADWPMIKQARPNLKLYVSYGWTNLDSMGGQPGQELKFRLQQMLMQGDIEFGLLSSAQMVELMHKAKYYVHPLNRADSDLFGFSLMKARAAGCVIVVPSVAFNGFRDMAERYIPYRDWINGEEEAVDNVLACEKPESWDNLVKDKWLPLLNGGSHG